MTLLKRSDFPCCDLHELIRLFHADLSAYKCLEGVLLRAGAHARIVPEDKDLHAAELFNEGVECLVARGGDQNGAVGARLRSCQALVLDNRRDGRRLPGAGWTLNYLKSTPQTVYRVALTKENSTKQ